jgi:LPXTG-motif cell wall-anchored protein
VDEWVKEVLVGGGLFVLFGLVLLENLLPPIPSEVILPLAGFLVADGEMSFVAAMIAATAGSVVGALIIYGVGRYGGRPLLLRYGDYLYLNAERIDRSEAWFEQYGQRIVFFGRMIPGIRSVVSVPAGLARMDLTLFTLLTLAGSAIWNGALIGAGWALGDNWEDIAEVIGPISRYVLVAGGLLIIAGAGVYYWRKRNQRAQDPE